MKSVLIDKITDAMIIGQEELNSTIRALEDEGYEWSDMTVEQAGTGRTTEMKVLCRDD